MHRRELVELYLDKVEEVERLEAKLKDRVGRAVITKMVCKDHHAARQIEALLLCMMQNPENLIEYGTINMVDESRCDTQSKN